MGHQKSKEYTALVKAIENAVSAPPQAPGLSIANSQVVTTTGPVAIKLTGSLPRQPGNVTYLNVTQPAHGTLTGTAPDLTEFNWAAKGNGKWSDAAHWSPTAPAATGQTHYALNFTSSGTATHDLNDGFRINRLSFASMATLDGTKSITFAANGGSLPQIHQSTGVAVNISNPLTLQDNLHFDGDSGGKITLTGIISGNGGIVKNNSNILEIRQKKNTYSGTTTVDAGTLSLNNENKAKDPDYPVGTGTITLGWDSTNSPTTSSSKTPPSRVEAFGAVN